MEKKAREEGEKLLRENGIDIPDDEAGNIIGAVQSVSHDDIQDDGDANDASESRTGSSFSFDSITNLTQDIVSLSIDALKSLGEMNALINPETGTTENAPTDESLFQQIRSRVFRMFLMSFGRARLQERIEDDDTEATNVVNT